MERNIPWVDSRERFPIPSLSCMAWKSNERSFKRRSDERSANYREKPHCLAGDHTAGIGLGRTEQDAVDGFARSEPDLCDRSREWRRLEGTRSPGHSMGCCCPKR